MPKFDIVTTTEAPEPVEDNLQTIYDRFISALVEKPEGVGRLRLEKNEEPKNVKMRLSHAANRILKTRKGALKTWDDGKVVYFRLKDQ